MFSTTIGVFSGVSAKMTNLGFLPYFKSLNADKDSSATVALSGCSVGLLCRVSMGCMIEGAFDTTANGFLKTAIGLEKGMGGIFVCNQKSLSLTLLVVALRAASAGLIPDCGKSLDKTPITIGVEEILWEIYHWILQA